MNGSSRMKDLLIVQAFAPLFLILLVKFGKLETIGLVWKFFRTVCRSPYETLTKAMQHPLFATTVLELVCIGWFILSLWGFWKFTDSQNANLVSQGEALKKIEKIPDAGVTFFTTYVLPLAMDDLNTKRGLIVFCVLMAMLVALMRKTDLYYQNPVLVFLGYEVFRFQFDTTQVSRYQETQLVGITRRPVREGKSIKRQEIADDVFYICEENEDKKNVKGTDHGFDS